MHFKGLVMRVCHFCFTLDPSKGGVSKGVLNLSEQLTIRGVENQIVSFGNTRSHIGSLTEQIAKLQLLGVEFLMTIARIDNVYGIGELKNLRKRIFNLPQPDLLVLHAIYTFSTLFGYLYAKKSGIPYVVMPHGSLTKYHEKDNKAIKAFAKWLLISRILRQAGAIIVTCESEKTELNPTLHEKTWQIEYGATVTGHLNKNSQNTSLGFKAPRIVFSGRFDKKKNLAIVIQALPYILKQYPETILDIAGSGTSKEVKRMESLVSSLRLERHVVFHGWIESAKMMELLTNARLLTLPSQNENFAIAVAEALSAGIPCVVSKFVGTAEIVAKFHAGEVIDEITPASVADAIIKVLNGNESIYKVAATKAAQSSLNWSKSVFRWKSLITYLVSMPKSPN